jgi:hypothetical protein
VPPINDHRDDWLVWLAVLKAAVKVVAFVGGLTGAALFVIFVWDWLDDGPAKRASLNPAIFAAFRVIERQCMAESSPHQTVRCQGVLEKKASCDRSNPDCTARDYYCVLYRLGFEFELPPYYRSDSAYRGKSPC